MKTKNKASCFAFVSFVVVAVLLLVVPETQSVEIAVIAAFSLTGKDAKQGGVEEAVTRKAVQYVNDHPLEFFTSNGTVVNVISLDTESTVSGGLKAVSSFPAGAVMISGSNCDIVEAIAPVIEGLNIIHYTFCPSEALRVYPHVALMVPSEREQGTALADLIHHFDWDINVGVLSTSSAYGAEVLGQFISHSVDDIGLKVLSSQQFYPGTQELWQIMTTVKSSQARVIVNIMGVSDMQTVIRHAERLDMLTDKYVWLCSDACANNLIFTDPETGKVDENLRNKFTGMIGVRYQTGQGKLYEDFLDEWEKEDPFLYAGAGKRETSFFAPYAHDALHLYFKALKTLTDVPGASITADGIVKAQASANSSVVGFTGHIRMDETGRERIRVFDIVNLRYDSLKADFTDFVIVGKWNESAKYHGKGMYRDDIDRRFEFDYKLQFRDGSYDFPDLDVRNSFKYWSCNDAEEKTDETGKSVRLEKPDGRNANNIDNSYRCDEFIDCYNMSDEWGCDVSFPVLFIVYGIFLFLFICFALFCLLFTCVFGYIFRRKRIRASSPTFLIIMCLAAILGYGGLFAFFGQPHTVSCNFRVWFLAVAVITVISALFAKSFRVWRLYRSPTEIKALKDWQLILFVIASVIPILIILVLWTGLATPTAMLVEASSDHREHLLCSYGSVAGIIGFYFFFFAIVAYVALFLLFGIFLSIATRNVVSTFNESRLIAISIYNITFSAIVTIPIVFVLKDSKPFITWIIIVTAFAYGFTATLLLQFFPKIWGIVVRDKFAKDPSTHSSGGGSSGPTHASVTSKDSKAIF